MGKYVNEFKETGTYFNAEVDKLNEAKVESFFNGISDVFDEFGVDKCIVENVGIDYEMWRTSSHNIVGNTVLLALYSFGDDNVISSYDVGVEEGGYFALCDAFNVYRDRAELSIKEYISGQPKFAAKVVREAQKLAGIKKKPYLSEFASQNCAAYVMEAVHDFMINKEEAKPICKAIVEVIKDYKN